MRCLRNSSTGQHQHKRTAEQFTRHTYVELLHRTEWRPCQLLAQHHTSRRPHTRCDLLRSARPTLWGAAAQWRQNPATELTAPVSSGLASHQATQIVNNRPTGDKRVKSNSTDQEPETQCQHSNSPINCQCQQYQLVLHNSSPAAGRSGCTALLVPSTQERASGCYSPIEGFGSTYRLRAGCFRSTTCHHSAGGSCLVRLARQLHQCLPRHEWTDPTSRPLACRYCCHTAAILRKCQAQRATAESQLCSHTAIQSFTHPAI